MDRSVRICNVEGCENKYSSKGLCIKHYSQLRYKQNSEAIKEKVRTWTLNNQQHVRDRLKRWRELHPDYTKEWKKTNKDRVLLYNHKHQQRRKQQLKKCTPKWVDVLELQSIYTNCPQDKVIDHIIPILSPHICGLEVPWNLQYLTPEENRRKNNRFEGMPK